MKKVAFDERGNQKVRKFLTGGLAGGTAAGLSIALANYLRDLYKETKPNTSMDDNILYLDVPGEEEEVEKIATLSGAVGATGGLLAALGSAALVRKLYQDMKKKELQAQLDKAQVAYTSKVLDEADAIDKQASSGVPMHTGDIATTTPLALLFLTTLASGALAYKGLNKYFPARKKPQTLEPKRVVIRRKTTQPGFYEEENDEETEKTASYDEAATETEMLDDALELVVKIAMHNPSLDSDLRDVVYAVADGRHNEFCSVSSSLGSEVAMDLVKNASIKEASEEDINLAISQCVKSAYLRPIVELLAFAEFNDMAPASVKAASDMSDEAQEALCKIAAVLGAQFRYDFWNPRYDDWFTVKKGDFITPSLQALLGEGLEGGLDPDGAEEAPLTVETDSELSESQRTEDLADEDIKNRRRADEQQTEDADEIDALMSGMAGDTSDHEPEAATVL